MYVDFATKSRHAAKPHKSNEFYSQTFGVLSDSLTVQTPPLADLSMTECPPPPLLPAPMFGLTFCFVLELFLERKKEARLELLLSALSVRRNRFWNIWKGMRSNYTLMPK